MNPTVWDATSVILVIGAIGSWLVTVIAAVSAAISSSRANARGAALEVKAAVIENKTDVIKGSVDGQASAAQAREEKLQDELKLLREILAEKKQEAALVASKVEHIERSTTAIEATVNGPRKG